MAEPSRDTTRRGAGLGEAALFVGGPPAVAATVVTGVVLGLATDSIWVALGAVAGGLMQIPLSIWLLEAVSSRSRGHGDGRDEAPRRPAARSLVALPLLSVLAGVATGLVTAAGFGWVVAGAFVIVLGGLVVVSLLD
jgi:hypothetical protein